ALGFVLQSLAGRIVETRCAAILRRRAGLDLEERTHRLAARPGFADATVDGGGSAGQARPLRWRRHLKRRLAPARQDLQAIAVLPELPLKFHGHAPVMGTALDVGHAVLTGLPAAAGRRRALLLHRVTTVLAAGRLVPRRALDAGSPDHVARGRSRYLGAIGCFDARHARSVLTAGSVRIAAIATRAARHALSALFVAVPRGRLTRHLAGDPRASVAPTTETLGAARASERLLARTGRHLLAVQKLVGAAGQSARQQHD